MSTEPPAPVAGPSKSPDALPLPRKPFEPERPYVWRLLGLDTASEILAFRPGRKSIITAVVLGSLTAAITWDRTQAKRLRTEYQERVKRFAEEPAAIEDLPRRVTVLTTRLPDDPQEDRAVIWFKRYVKPILNAAAIEYTILHGNQPGALGRQLAARFKTRRVADLAPAEGSPIPGQLGYTDADIENRELIDGGTVIVGRTALKEYFWALKAGHLSEVDLAKAQRATAPGSSYDMVEEEELANELAEDGFFDRALAEAPSTELAEEKPAFDGGIYSSFSAPSPSLPSSPATPGPLLPSPSHLPPQPPLSIIDYSHPLGSMLWWPLKLYTYLFCERYKVEKGGRAALAIIENRTRPLSPPTDDRGIWKEEVEEGREWLNEKRKMRRGANEAWRADTSGSADLDVGLADERFFDKAFRKWPANIAQARYMYEDELKGRIIKASEAGGAEEASLRAERLEKEGRWRRNLQGWRFTRPGSGVFYDRERMDGALKVFEEAQ